MMGMTWVDDKWVLICNTCKQVSPNRWYQKDGGIEGCENCVERMPDNRPRDAMGNVVKVSDDVLGKFSYAIGEPILGQRHYAEILRRKGLAQKG